MDGENEEITEERKMQALLEKKEEARIARQQKIDEEFSKKFNGNTLYKVLFINFLCSLLINVDHGSLPGCTEEVKYKFQINNLGFGALGTAVYLGVTVGSLAAMKTFSNSRNVQSILALCMAVNGISCFTFTATKFFVFNLCLRALNGFG